MSFTTEQWRKLIIKHDNEKLMFNHRYLEICIFSHLANELRSKDMFIVGSNCYADYRTELLPLNDCARMLDDYCSKIDIASNGADCVRGIEQE